MHFDKKVTYESLCKHRSVILKTVVLRKKNVPILFNMCAEKKSCVNAINTVIEFIKTREAVMPDA